MLNIKDFSMDFFSLKGKTALVTGGNSGLGQAFSLALAKAGADLFIPSVIEEEGETKALLTEAGAGSAFMKTDLTLAGQPAEAVRQCLAAFGSLDILVNCAGICLIDDVLSFGREQWDTMIAVNLTAAFEMSHEAAKVMIPGKSGKIINICSLFSYLGGLGSPAYTASKHALAGLTRTYADELAGHNIQVNGIAPGYYATHVTRATRSDPVKSQRILDHIPAGRWGEPQDLMGAVIFLASRASDYINGTLLAVDGGYLVR